MRLLLVDGHYYLYRSFYAIRGLRNSRGEPTNAIYGYAKAIRKMMADLKPDLAAVIWDSGLPARRTTLQPEYKQNRTEMPDDLFGPASVSAENTEADDLIASYARAASAEGVEVIIATNDKDILQLTCDTIRIYSTAKTDAGTEGFCLLGVPEVRAKWGVLPSQIADVLALTGDSSDNIRGVPGIGDKTAVALITEHGSVENLLADPAAISNPKLRGKIIASRETIIANREMVRLDEDLPLPHAWSTFQVRPKSPELIRALRECEFQALLQEVQSEVAKREAPGQQELF